MAQGNFVSVDLSEVIVGEALPTSIFLYIDFRFITFRGTGDVVDRDAFDRLQFKKVKSVFIQEEDKPKFLAWSKEHRAGLEQEVKPITTTFGKIREDAHRKTLDIFQANHPDKLVAKTMAASKQLALEVMKAPYAIQSLAQLQAYSRGTVDHSVNVSILSVYLAMQMGYTHHLILQHLGMGALLHDVGKIKIPVEDGDSKAIVEEKMRQHPIVGVEFLEASGQEIPNEVKMIISQHHEYADGTGYPRHLRGAQIYDLARIVTIANVFDELVGDAKGSLQERQKTALKLIDENYYRKLDPMKLQKAVKILRMGV